jgi:prephenate dehydrogenase
MSSSTNSEDEEQSDFSLAKQRVAIVGLGLIGGSLALALRGKTTALFGVDPDPLTRALATQLGVVDEVSDDLSKILPRASMIVLAAPVRAILSIVNDLPRFPPSRAVIIDLGSTKADIASALSTLPDQFEPVAGHPMCGKEVGGLANAEAGLFSGSTFVLSQLPNSTPRACGLAQQLAESVGAYPFWLDPEIHDQWIAQTSHLPYLLSNALAFCTSVELAELVGPGFRSVARLAPSPRRMMIDILITNQANILDKLKRYKAHLDDLEHALVIGDFAALQDLLGHGAQNYTALTESNKTVKPGE